MEYLAAVAHGFDALRDTAIHPVHPDEADRKTPEGAVPRGQMREVQRRAEPVLSG